MSGYPETIRLNSMRGTSSVIRCLVNSTKPWVPRSIENIDVVWKFGPYSIKSAFEIEHSTSVYSGILRLSDLRAEAPNSNYPMFIVASEDRRKKVFDELRRLAWQPIVLDAARTSWWASPKPKSIILRT